MGTWGSAGEGGQAAGQGGAGMRDLQKTPLLNLKEDRRRRQWPARKQDEQTQNLFIWQKTFIAELHFLPYE